MQSKKRLIFILAILLAGGISWGVWTFALSAPTPAAVASEKEHKDHEKHGDEKEHAEGKAAAEHDDHADKEHAEEHAEKEHGDGEEEEGHDDHAGHGHAKKASVNGICPEHNVPEAEDALCQPDRIAALQPGQGLKVRLGAVEAAERVGIAAAPPVPAGEGSASWPGQAVFNRDRVAHLSALAGGTVKTVRVALGDRVKAGAVLAEIASPEAAALKGALRETESRSQLAEAAYLREKDLLEKGITSRQEFQQAEAEWRQAQSAAAQARQQLGDYGLAAGDGSILPLRAPFAGTVVERTAVTGEAVAPGTPLFTVVDLSNLWIDISVPEEALLDLRPGLEIAASFSALPGRAFPGKIFWVAPALDEKTRMLKALAKVENREGLLRSGLFGEVHPAAKVATGALAVPADALQIVDGAPYVFVQMEKDLFELRRVSAGRKTGRTVVVDEGISAADRIVTAQAFALKSEVLKARLGASCADH
jgi:cobalt-zinc-cadmium efflux system membrane fusion protein